MAQTLSRDLRDRVVAAIEDGLSCRAAASRFGVSASSAIRWRQLLLRQGHTEAMPRGGDRHSGKIEAHSDFILGLVAGQGDITLEELRAQLTSVGVFVATSSLHRFFVRHGITRKKRPATRSSRTGATS